MKIKLTKAKQIVAIHTPFIRLDDFLKFAAAVMSGGQAKEVIQAGQVQLNGEVCTMRGKKLVPGDVVTWNHTIYEVAAE